MAVPVKRQHSLKPIFILTIAAIVLSKVQRAASEEASILAETSDTENAICPDYCSLPADRATKGKAPFRMWFYDPSEGSCRRFRWSGRGGNKNRFYRKVDCEETCSRCSPNEIEGETSRDKMSSYKDSACSHSLDEGRCGKTSLTSAQLVWHFNSGKAKCTPFIFYGCGGNSNRFSTEKECEDICE